MISEKQKLHLAKLAELKRGKVSPLKGVKRQPFSDEWRENMSNAQKGKIPWNKGRKFKGMGWGRKSGWKMSEEHKKKISEGGKRMWDRRGRKPENKRNRQQDRKYKKWRRKVFERDDYTCQICAIRGGDLEAHHKKRWAEYPKLRYKINNGITLCVICHKKIDPHRK